VIPRYDLVVPTVGRPSLGVLLDELARQDPPGLDRLVLVDDRPGPGDPLTVPVPLAGRAEVLRSGGRGPAAARNVGWRAGTAPWVVFVDDDVVPEPGWGAALVADLAGAASGVGAVQGVVRVPLPTGRRATDWERDVAGLAHAAWITADLAYRRIALVATGGFDEGFRRAYREDADLALRVAGAGWDLVVGDRRVSHPVRPAPWWVSVSRQRGNGDDPRMAARHGAGWRAAASAPRGRFRAHALTTGLGAVAVMAAAAGQRRLAAAAALGWLAATGDFAARRIAPGPRTPAEVAAMVVTSVAIPPVAVAHRLAGTVPAHRSGAVPTTPADPAAAVLFDRDGTLVVDVPYNGDPDRVAPVPGAAEAVARARAAGRRVGVVSNQSGVARGLLTPADVEAVNRRIDALVGPFDVWVWCPHDADAGCACRKPAPGLVHEAARRLGVAPGDCTVIGDIGSDLEAARRAGARGVLVPTPETRPEEIAAAPEVAPTILDAVELVLGRAAGGDTPSAPALQDVAAG
jgi:HAD superfamily hydrolase (TIGR01662 family)